MAITNLTNTTWVFKDGPLDFSYFDDLVQKFVPIDFISNTASYKFFAVRSPSTDLYNIGYSPVAPTQVNIVYSQNNSTGVFSWSNTAYQTIQITGGAGVRYAPFIDFLSNNAICQTPLVTVTFNMNGKGTAVSSQTFARGTKANMPIPSDDGYIFAGWYTDSDLTTRFNFNMSIMSNITLYAKWIPKAIKTKVSGAWNSGTPLVKVNNTWKDVDKAFVKVNGVWQPVINNEQPPIVKCAEFSTASNSNFNSNSFNISYGYLSFKILTNDPFLFNIDVDFTTEYSWYTVGVHSSATPSALSDLNNYFTIDKPILLDLEKPYRGAINIQGGNINKYIVIYFDKSGDVGSLSGTFKFLSNYYSGGIYMSSDSIYKSFIFCEKTFWFIDGMTWQDWVNSSLDTSTRGMVLEPPYHKVVEGRGVTSLLYLDSFIISDDSGESLVCYGERYWDADYTGGRDEQVDLVISLSGPQGRHNVVPTDKIISTTYVEGTSFNYYV